MEESIWLKTATDSDIDEDSLGLQENDVESACNDKFKEFGMSKLASAPPSSVDANCFPRARNTGCRQFLVALERHMGCLQRRQKATKGHDYLH